MAVPKFTIASSLNFRGGDYVLLAFLDSEKCIFHKPSLPKEIQRAAKSSPDSGGSLTTFCGNVGRSEVYVRSVRLDTQYSDSHRELKKAIVAAIAAAPREGCKRVVVPIDERHLEFLHSTHEATILGGYSFNKYLSRKSKPVPVEVTGIRTTISITDRIRECNIIYECTNAVRDLMNEPPNVKNPVMLAGEFAKLGRKSGLSVTVWDDKRVVRERCGGLYGVGMGAKAKPHMVIAEYNPRGAKKHLCLVGKGVTYDSGGYGIKPAASQIGMKYDMGGAAMVFGAICAIARMRMPIRVTAITPLAENDISGESMHTTSVLTTRSGKTIEVEHTDAEGRIILADALTIAGERKPDWIIDAATLTGACVVALGEEIAGLWSNDKTLAKAIIQAGDEAGELYWEMPLFLPHTSKIKATIADVKNRGDAWGGAITAAVFLKQWVDDKMKWAHLDIAGPGGKENPLDFLGKGAKGFGVKTLVNLARKFAK